MVALWLKKNYKSSKIALTLLRLIFILSAVCTQNLQSDFSLEWSKENKGGPEFLPFFLIPGQDYYTLPLPAYKRHIITGNNHRLGSVFVVTRLSLLCQVGDDVIRPCKICGGCQIRVPRSIHSFSIVPYNLDSNLYWEYVERNTEDYYQKVSTNNVGENFTLSH